MYNPDWFKGYKILSTTRFLHKGIDMMELTSWGRNRLLRSERSHCLVIGLIRSATWAPIKDSGKGDWSLVFSKDGIHGSAHKLILSPVPILQWTPFLSTYLPFRILLQAYEPPKFSLSSKIEQWGKNLDLNTL